MEDETHSRDDWSAPGGVLERLELNSSSGTQRSAGPHTLVIAEVIIKGLLLHAFEED